MPSAMFHHCLLIVWQSGPKVVSQADSVAEFVGSLVPIAMLWVSKQILDAVQAHFNGQPLPENFWWLVAAEFVLAAVGRDSGPCRRIFRRASG